MSDTGIGARMLRKEDHRFITGKGRYTDDINLPGQAVGYFLRSPHAHAEIKKIDIKKAEKAPGVLCVLTGEDAAADNIGGVICGWMIHSKDGSPMKAGPHPVLAQGKVRHVGDQVAVVVARTTAQAKAAAELINVTYKVLEANVDPVASQKRGAPKVHDVASRNTVFEWEIGDKAATDAAFSSAAHITTLDLVNNRLAPNAMEPRAAIGSYDEGDDHYTLYTTSQNPHVARLVISAFVGLAPEHKLRVIAPDVGGGFGSKIFIYAEEVVCLWASRRAGGVPVKWVSDRSEAFLTRCQWPRSCDQGRTGHRQGWQGHRASCQDDCQYGCLSVDVRVVGSHLSVCNAAVGPVQYPQHLCGSGRGLYQHVSGGCLSRGRQTGSDLCGGAADGNGGS